MKIYTKTGDKGTTALIGAGRVPKDSLRVEAYGSVDEANAALGVVRSVLDDEQLDEILARIQHALFDLGADLAAPLDSRASEKIARIDEDDVARLEGWIDALNDEPQPLRNFILPGGHPASAALQLARTVARRAERASVRLAHGESVNEQAVVYLNRLSDLLFVMARVVNSRSGIDEVLWHVKQRK